MIKTAILIPILLREALEELGGITSDSTLARVSVTHEKEHAWL
jgi:hypothetical protein